jgi:uncharacterized protein YkwD
LKLQPPPRRHSKCRPASGSALGPGHRRGCRAARGGRRTHPLRRSAHGSRRVHVVSLPSQTGLAEATLARAQATLARVLSVPCENEQLMPEPGNLALVRASVLCLINRERASNGEQPLVASAQLEGAAEAHNKDMIAADYFEHVSPNGETPVDRVRAMGYIPGPPAGYIIGENLAWGTFSLATPQAIVAAWIASPGHLANILESQYQDTGIAVVPEVPAALAGGAPGATYAQEFGVITH